MTVKLLPHHLRLLNPSLPVTRLSTMNLNPAAKPSSRVITVFSRIFPNKLKYQCLPTKLGIPVLLGSTRRFSTRVARPGPGGVRASKGLIDDEAELSDWVSGLRSDSFLTRDDSDRGSKGREERGGRESDRVSPAKRRGERDSGGFAKSDRETGRSSSGSFPRNSRGKLGTGVGKRGNEGFVLPRRENGRRRDSDSDEWEQSNRGMGRDSFGSISRNERGKERFGGELKGKHEGFVSGMRESGRQRGKDSVTARTGGRATELRYGNRGGSGGDGDGGFKKGGKNLGKGSVLISDEGTGDEEEEEERGMNLMESFSDLISEEDSADDDGDNMLKNAESLFSSNKEGSLPKLQGSAGGSDSYLSETRFDQCSVSPASLKGIKDAGYEKMTVVQEATLPVILEGKDVLAKARTGTGKTVAFLLPSIEVVVRSPPVGRDQKLPPIVVLVICPTRELANQAAAEAKTLLKYHPSLGVQVVIGGTRLPQEQKRMQTNPCQILVATPGRLKDHIENTAGFATRIRGVKVLVLDEADHLLDMGFRRDIEKIIAAVPKQRQTLLFSATVPQEVRQICHIALKNDHEFIDTVEEGSEATHAQVRQMHLVAPLDKQFSLLYILLKEHISEEVDYKVLVFCTTAMVTSLVAALLSQFNLNVREIHSRKTQNYRTRVSDEFRNSKRLILVTSDVSARGVDYPDVTLVIQVGLPADREQYIHRLGRTGRKGKEGQGILLLAPWEEFFLSTLKDLPITKAPVPLVDPETQKKVERALTLVEMKNKEVAYQAWLGYYNSNKNVGRDKQRLVELANEFSRSMGLGSPPAISKLVLGKMGLRNVPGLRSK